MKKRIWFGFALLVYGFMWIWFLHIYRVAKNNGELEMRDKVFINNLPGIPVKNIIESTPKLVGIIEKSSDVYDENGRAVVFISTDTKKGSWLRVTW
jgi:hypothetical protein